VYKKAAAIKESINVSLGTLDIILFQSLALTINDSVFIL